MKRHETQNSLRKQDATSREATARAERTSRKSKRPYATTSPVYRAANASVSPASSAILLTARAPCPTWPSARKSTGNPEDVACYSAAHILYACTGSTRVSLVNTVNSTAG